MHGIEDGDGSHDAAALVGCFWCQALHPGAHPLSVCPTCRSRLSTMRSLGMGGSYPLNDEAIDEVLTCRAPGNYALGYMDGDAFVVFYVGRSGSDVRQRLHEWVGMPSPSERYASPARAPWKVSRRGGLPLGSPSLGRVAAGETAYTRFAYSYAASAEAAFEKECRNFDDFGGCAALDNVAPPAA